MYADGLLSVRLPMGLYCYSSWCSRWSSERKLFDSGLQSWILLMLPVTGARCMRCPMPFLLFYYFSANCSRDRFEGKAAPLSDRLSSKVPIYTIDAFHWFC